MKAKNRGKQDNRPEKWLRGPNWIVVRGTGPKTHPPITWTLPKPPGVNPPKDKQNNRADVVGKMRTGPVRRGTGPKTFPARGGTLPKPPGANPTKSDPQSDSR